MANLGSEVTGIFLASHEKKGWQVAQLQTRAKKILDEIISLPDMATRKNEMALLEQVIRDIASPDPLYQVDKESLEEYFSPFAIRVLSQNSQ